MGFCKLFCLAKKEKAFPHHLLTHSRKIYIALALALLARLATYPFAGMDDPLFYEYGYIAKHLVVGEGYTLFHWLDGETLKMPSAFMPPGQTYVIAFFFWLFGIGSLSYHLIFLLNALLGTAGAFMLWKITQRITSSERTATIALYAAALFPPFISASATWGVASSVLFLNGLLIYTALLFSDALSEQRKQVVRGVQFGLVAGVLALFRAEAPLIAAFILLAVLILHRDRFMTSLKYGIASGLVICAAMSPWMIANYIRFDAVILGSTSGGFNLWRGNNPTASGGGWRVDGSLVTIDNETHREVYEKLKAVPPKQWERAYSAELARRATVWMAENPGTVATLALKKALLIWIADPYHYSHIKYVYAFFQIIAFGIGVFGVLRLRKSGLPSGMRSWVWIAGAACLASTLLTMVFFSLPRYQIFLVGIYFPVIAIGADELLLRLRARRDQRQNAAELVAS